MIADVVTAYVDGATAEGYPRTGTWRSCGRHCARCTPSASTTTTLMHGGDGRRARRADPEELLDALLDDARGAYARREAEIDGLTGAGAMRQLEAQRAAQRDRPQVA